MVKWLATAAWVAMAGCSVVPNPSFCDENADCKNGFVCNLETNGCEEAVHDDAGVDAAGSCVLDDECASGVCRSEGACEAAENVLYVAPDGISAGACPADARCDLVYALSKVTPTVSTIRLASGVYDLASDLVIDQNKPDVTIVGGRSAILQRTAPGVVIDVHGVTAGTPIVTLRGMTMNKGLNCHYAGLRLVRVLLDNAPPEAIPWIATMACTLTVTDSEFRDSPAAGILGQATDLDMAGTTISGSSGPGVSLSYRIPGSSAGVKIRRSRIERSVDMGIKVNNTGSFTLERSMIAFNAFGGVTSTGATYDVTNNFIVQNGNQGQSVEIGGLRVTGSGRVLHNTIVFNYSPPDSTYAGGVYCDNGTAANNIIVANQRGNEELPFAQIRGSCDFTGSLVDPMYATPVFVDIVTYDYHIASASPAVNAGGTPMLTEDFDGDPRSDGAGDLGADERP